MFKGFAVWSVILLCAIPSIAQKWTITGSVDNIHGESLPSAHIVVLPDSLGTLSDLNGNFKTEVAGGEKVLVVTFIGYQTHRVNFTLSSDFHFSIVLVEKQNELKEIVIEDKRDPQQELFKSNQTSTNILSKDDVTSIPVLGGEADVIKTLQLLPGTVRGVEGSSDLFVRGGAADQNLVLLDGAPVYNTSHLFGFLSVFNPDVLDKVESINGGFPARYGGRLSSILNVNTSSDVPERTQVSGDVGLIASRLFVEQPIVKDKASFWVAARRTYIDKVVAVAGEELPYFFYDLNGKLILNPNGNDHIELSYYGGEDILDFFRDRNNDGNGFLTTYKSGNDSQSLSWKRDLKNNLGSELIVTRSRYLYEIRNIFEDNQLLVSSDIEDYGARWMLTKDSVLGKAGVIKAGFEWVRHDISPNLINTTGLISELFKSSATSARVANEFSLHAEYAWSPLPKLDVAVGLRASMAVVKNKKYLNPEPRFSARYQLPNDQALKLSYSRMVQYIHRISNSAISTPTDIWYPVTDSISPQSSHQVAMAWQKGLADRHLFFSVETYYKSMQDLIGYEEGTNLFLNTDFESKLIQGKGRAYGIEILLRKDAGKFTGWISYSLAWSWRKFNEIEKGQWFPSRYDRRHNGAVVAQYALSKRWHVSMVWEFISGSRFTPVIGQYITLAPTLTGIDVIPLYSGVNRVKLADTHRLDLGLKFSSKPGKKFQWKWFAGVYNVYNRATPIGIVISQDETDGSLKYQQPGLFGLLPFISYGFKL
jgi:hypothetical protein